MFFECFSVTTAAAFDDSKVVDRRRGGLAGMKAILAEFKPSTRTHLISRLESKRATPLMASLLFIYYRLTVYGIGCCWKNSQSKSLALMTLDGVSPLPLPGRPPGHAWPPSCVR
jgi:hypothetical protein